MKKTDFTEEASGLVVKGQRGTSRSREAIKDPSVSSSNACYYCRKPGHIKKNCFKYKEILKKKGGIHIDGVVPVKSQNKPTLLKKQMRIHVCPDNSIRKGKVLICLVI